MVLANAKKRARRDGACAALEAIPARERIELRDAGALTARVTFNPPNKRRRDVDGVIASLKACIDGIADAIGLDDSMFRIAWPEEFSEPVKGGQILVEILPIPV
jgi:crossover junction endodeoxyribonuclease RusA